MKKTKLFSHFNFKKDDKKSSQPSTSTTGHASNKNDDDEEMKSMENSNDSISFRDTPFYITSPLRNYQIEGLNWMISLYHNGISGILADEMGLGKTVQSISLLGYLKHFKNIPKYHLVICPKSTLSNWVSEFKRWCPTIHVESLQGNQVILISKHARTRRHTYVAMSFYLTFYLILKI